MAQLRGVYPCVMTPLRENEDLDFEALRREIDWLIDAGVHGLLVTGTFGEYAQTNVMCIFSGTYWPVTNTKNPTIEGNTN